MGHRKTLTRVGRGKNVLPVLRGGGDQIADNVGAEEQRARGAMEKWLQGREGADSGEGGTEPAAEGRQRDAEQ